MPQLTTRDAVTRALAAMEIAESCSHPEIRNSFTTLAETWLEQASELANAPIDEPQATPPSVAA